MDTLTKLENESVLYDMDMSGLGRLASTDTIASVNSVTADKPGLSIADIAHDGKALVQFRVSGGTAGEMYEISVSVSTASGDILIGRGRLLIQS